MNAGGPVMIVPFAVAVSQLPGGSEFSVRSAG
jgi:hypothetical protein